MSEFDVLMWVGMFIAGMLSYRAGHKAGYRSGRAAGFRSGNVHGRFWAMQKFAPPIPTKESDK